MSSDCDPMIEHTVIRLDAGQVETYTHLQVVRGDDAKPTDVHGVTTVYALSFQDGDRSVSITPEGEVATARVTLTDEQRNEFAIAGRILGRYWLNAEPLPPE